MRDYSTVRPRVFRKPELAECGLVAGILYVQGWLRCDNFGRLDGSVKSLATELVSHYVIPDQITLREIETARAALVREKLWHLYQVNGREYIEYLGYDQDQIEGWLPKRGAKPEFPDDPARPDLWAQNRIRYQGKKREKLANPDGGADLPPEPATGMPTPGAAQGAVPDQASAATGMPTPGAADAAHEPKLDWWRWSEKTFAVPPSRGDSEAFTQLKATGITDELIIHMIERAIVEKARRPLGLARSMLADLVPFGVRTVADLVKHQAAQQERASPSPGDEGPPDEEPDEIALRLAQQRKRAEADARAS